MTPFHRYLWGVFIATIIVLAVGFSTQAHAHSTKGLKKIVIDWEKLRIDDVAYHVEPWVVQGMGNQADDGRYMVRDFTGITQEGDRVTVNFIIADRKGPEFPSSTRFERRGDGTWAHVDETGQVLAQPVYTYNKPPVSHLARGMWVAGGICVLSIAGFLALRSRKRTGVLCDAPPCGHGPDALSSGGKGEASS